MKIQSIIVAASLALVPATAFAGDKKKEELAKAKAEAKEKALEAAKAKAAAKTANLKEAAAEKKAAAAAPAAAPANDTAEKETHARNVGAIERLQQIADATNNADLKTIVQRLSDKETKRHTMATGG